MTISAFKAIVEANGGEGKVLVLSFDNVSRQTFVAPHEAYSHADYLDEENECFKFTSSDIKGNILYVYKPVETLQGITFAGPDNNRWDYDPQTI